MAPTDAVFEAVTDREAFLRWAEAIRSDYPRAASIHNALLMHGRGLVDMYRFYALKDKPQANVIMFKDKTNQTTIGLYCPVAHEAELLDALARTKLISWNQTVCFFYVPETLEPRLRSLVQDKIGVSGKLDSSLADLYTYCMENDSKKLLCPSGFTVKRLSPEATRQMFSIWKYSECTKTNHFLELCKKAPCAGVYRTPGEVSEQVLDITVTGLPEAGEDEKAVAWATSTYYGPLGLIGVDESLKKDDPEEKKLRKRLERLVVSACAHAMLREGFLVHCYQEEDEDVIRSMPGLTKDRPYTWLWRCDQMPLGGEQEHMETK